MISKKPDIHCCDDWLLADFRDRQSLKDTTIALQDDPGWQEVVRGLSSIAVQFDPAEVMPDKAVDKFANIIGHSASTTPDVVPPIIIPVCYDDAFAFDKKHIATSLGIAPTRLAAWHSEQHFSVSMLGFMPGFAYLENTGSVKPIGRLATPRQQVPAGSIGIIGDQSCIYSFDSPGGWPIIGRTPISLFDANLDHPALLSADQPVSFQSIDSATFKAISAGKLNWR